MSHEETLNRWRLILGKQAGQQISFGNGAALENGISCFDLEDALEFLYSREYGEDVRREGGAGKGEPGRAVSQRPHGLRKSAACFQRRPWRYWNGTPWSATSSQNF